MNEEDAEVEVEALVERILIGLNELTPEEFQTSVNEIRKLNIYTEEKMTTVVNMVYEAAVRDHENSATYALMCKGLATMKITGDNPSDSIDSNFWRLIITRCQNEFENELENKKMIHKAKEIESCDDPEEEKAWQMTHEEEGRKIRMESIGNIRFIGELFKQGMVTKKIVNFCIEYLLWNKDESNLECLCELLTMIGESLEMNDELAEYFKQIRIIIDDDGPEKISSRVRLMLIDVIDLRANRWVPKTDDKQPVHHEDTLVVTREDILEVCRLPETVAGGNQSPAEEYMPACAQIDLASSTETANISGNCTCSVL